MGDRQQRSLCLDIPHGRVHRFDPATGSDDVFGVGQPGGPVGLDTGKDQSEWQIEWQTELAWARPVLGNAGLCSCFRSSGRLPGTAELHSNPW
jgi:sugar lactone lactonase YvrE